MRILVFALLLLGVIAIVADVLRKKERRRLAEWPVRASQVLSSPEQLLYRQLRAAFPELVVLAQVALSQLLEVQRGRGQRAVFNRISQLVADFVVCAPDFTTIVVIELDDGSHDDAGRGDAVARKSAALAAAGIPLLHFDVSYMPSALDVLDAVNARRALPPAAHPSSLP